MPKQTIGFAFCGSFCTFEKAFAMLERLCETYQVIPIFSHAAWQTDTRFGLAQEHIRRASALCGAEPIHTIVQAEPIGPRKLLDALVIAPCTGNTLAKLAHGIADTPVTMAAKSHLRNGRPVLLGLSTNDGLATAAENIGRLLARRHYFFIPFGQDDPIAKPNSLIFDPEKGPAALEAALQGVQLQPVLTAI